MLPELNKLVTRFCGLTFVTVLLMVMTTRREKTSTLDMHVRLRSGRFWDAFCRVSPTWFRVELHLCPLSMPTSSAKGLIGLRKHTGRDVFDELELKLRHRWADGLIL